jgi:hypothetical protein
MKTQYITNQKGEKLSVILSFKEYKKIMDELDEYNCIKSYDHAKKHTQEFIPAEKVFALIESKRKGK